MSESEGGEGGSVRATSDAKSERLFSASVPTSAASPALRKAWMWSTRSMAVGKGGWTISKATMPRLNMSAAWSYARPSRRPPATSGAR